MSARGRREARQQAKKKLRREKALAENARWRAIHDATLDRCQGPNGTGCPCRFRLQGHHGTAGYLIPGEELCTLCKAWYRKRGY